MTHYCCFPTLEEYDKTNRMSYKVIMSHSIKKIKCFNKQKNMSYFSVQQKPLVFISPHAKKETNEKAKKPAPSWEGQSVKTDDFQN